jgi:Family of unknown function (DUF5519)
VDVDTDLPARHGPRPTTTSQMPHSQTDQQPGDAAVREELARRAFALDGVHERHSAVSVPGARALVLADDAATGPPEAFIRGREFAHLHPGPDWSLHLALPSPLADRAVARGWAELHPLARTTEVPGSLVMVYAPRDNDELEVVWWLVRASYEFATSSARNKSV